MGRRQSRRSEIGAGGSRRRVRRAIKDLEASEISGVKVLSAKPKEDLVK